MTRITDASYPTYGAPPHIDDIEPMKEAIAVLRERRIRFERRTRYQLKVGRFSFYPGRDTITEDGKPELKAKGLEQFLKWIS